MNDHQPESERDTLPKSTLFCSNCDHRGHNDSDWSVVESCHNIRYLCPDCGTELTVRPRSLPRARARPAVPNWPLVGFQAWLGLWRKTISA